MANYDAPNYFKKGQSGNPGGRPRGKSYDVAKILEEAGCNPFLVLAKLALESRSDKVKCEAASQLARYIAPQLKSIEHSTSEDSKLNITLNLSPNLIEKK
ncbi:MAG: DUF5681 domain-containing protein [Gammaproteobacteria bacterium]